MIVVVDDEELVLGMLVRTLRRDGRVVEGYESAPAALEACAPSEPELIISDVMMPEMDGHEFRARYFEQHPDRRTPFVFLSALSDAQDVVRGLDGGADDYLVKPVEPQVLVAKVKALLRRGTTPALEAVFRGDLVDLSLPQILQFCEKRGMTGVAEVSTPGGTVTLPFEAGELSLDDGGATEEALSRAMDASEGRVVIRSRPIGFEEIAGASSEPSAEAAERARSESSKLPNGRLSGVSLGDRLMQLQTEYDPHANSVVTVVILDGRVVSERRTSPSQRSSYEEISTLVDRQHAEVEGELRRKAEELVKRKTQPPAPPSKRERHDYVRKSLDLYRAGEYAAALELLEEGAEVYPDDGLLRANIGVVRRKLVE